MSDIVERASPERIWLAPACNVEERPWCEDDIGCCDECGEPTIEYRRADLIEAELARLRAEVEHLDGQIHTLLRENESLRAALTTTPPAGSAAG